MLSPVIRSRASTLLATSLLALTALPSHAATTVGDITGTLYGAPGFEIVEYSPGQYAPVGYIRPTLAYTLPGPFSGGQAAGAGVGIGSAQYSTVEALLGYRGLVMTPNGSYALGTLGANAAEGWTPVGAASSTAVAVNSSGLIVGSSTLYSPDGMRDLGGRGVYYDPGSSVAHQLAMPTTGFTDTKGYGISSTAAVSSTGVIVGYGSQFDGDNSIGTRALRWNSKTGTAQVLGSLPGTSEWGDNTAAASAVNAAGTAVGSGNTFNSQHQFLGFSAIRWEANTTQATELGHLGVGQDGTHSSIALAINKGGTTVGHSTSYSVEGYNMGERAVRWAANSTTPQELGSLGKNEDSQSFSYALGINDAGTIFGTSEKFSADGRDLGNRAVRWAAGSTEATELKLLSVGSGGESFSFAFSINAAGYIAGMANVNGSNAGGSLNDGSVHAVIWSPDGEVLDLNTLLPADSGWLLQSANSISDTGWVTGMALYQPEGLPSDYAYSRLFSMQLSLPVPEPTPTLLLAMGLATLAVMRRRRQH